MLPMPLTRTRARFHSARLALPLAFALFLGACAQSPQVPTVSSLHSPTLPLAPIRNVQDTHYGITVDDPYRYFENKNDPEVASWMKAHSDATHRTLRSIPGRAKVLADIKRLEDSVSARVTSVVRAPGDIYFYERRGIADNQFKLYKKVGLNGAEQLLVDPDAIQKATGKPHAINYYFPSPDGRLVAYGVSEQGSEAAFLHLLDTTNGQQRLTPISRADYGSVDWAPDGQSFLFTRLQEMKAGMTETEKYQRAAVYRVRVQDGIESAAVFSVDTPGIAMNPVESPFTGTTHDGRWVFAIIANGTQRELGIYVSSFADVQANRANWKRIATAADQVTGLAYFDDTLYLKSNKDAPRGKVLALNLKSPDLAAARTIVATGERVITGISSASDALYVEAREGNVKHLYKLAYGVSAPLTEVKLPVLGSFSLVGDEGALGATDPRLPGAIISLQSWTQATQIYQVNADGTVANTRLQPQGPFDSPADIEAKEVLVRSHDGAMVPMSIVHRKGMKLDGNNPTLLYGYASYGITEEPFFNVSRLAWINQGGVFAIANPRGSSVFGEQWYKGGYQTTKPNTWKDFNACAEYLIAQRYTRPARLGILGGSAGGILVGRAMTERPDLFAGVVAAVGALDAVRFETTANGVPNIPEFGTVKNEAGFKALLAMSTYHQIKDGVRYPAVLLTHGVNDPRVDVWESTKVAARLLGATAHVKDRRPVLLRLDYEAGHGVGNTKSQRQEEVADRYSFLLWSMGAPEFQPRE